MSKKSKLPLDLRVTDQIFYIEETKDKKEDVVLYEIKAATVTSIEMEEVDSKEIIINKKYNLPLINKPGRKELKEIITDPKDALEAIHEFIQDQLDDTERELGKITAEYEKTKKKAAIKTSLLKQNAKRFQGDDLLMLLGKSNSKESFNDETEEKKSSKIEVNMPKGTKPNDFDFNDIRDDEDEKD